MVCAMRDATVRTVLCFVSEHHGPVEICPVDGKSHLDTLADVLHPTL